MDAVMAAAMVVYVTVNLRTVEASLPPIGTPGRNDYVDLCWVLLAALRELQQAAEEVANPKHHDPARDLLAWQRLRTALAMVKDE